MKSMTSVPSKESLDALRYPIHLGVLTNLICAILLGGRRSFRNDALVAVSRLRPALRISNAANIPCSGPGVLTINHYYRPGFKAWWLALALSATVPSEIHWVMTGALTYPGRKFSHLRTQISGMYLLRIAKVYGFSIMPPMPPSPGEVMDRALSIRGILSFVKKNPSALIGLAPEGHDNLRGGLMVPPSGVGRFLWQLSRQGSTMLPVAGYESSDGFHLNFGKAYHLELPQAMSTHQVDKYISDLVMRRIAELMPEGHRGDYR